MRFRSKTDFEAETCQQWDQLWILVDNSSDSKQTQVKLKQILAHLHAWHRLFLSWYSIGLNGTPDLPAPGFNWQQTRQLNQQLDEEFAAVPMKSIRRRLKLSHGRVMKLVAELKNDQFLNAKLERMHSPLTSFPTP